MLPSNSLSMMKLSIIVLLIGCSESSQAFQRPVQRKAPLPRQRQTRLTSEAVIPYPADASSYIIEKSEFFPFDPSLTEDELSQQQQVEQQSRTTSRAVVSFKELFGEAFGTFWIVGIGSIASMTASFMPNPLMSTLPQVAAVWSVAVTSAILMASPLSGAHFNPAMTLAQAMFRNFDRRKVLPYCVAQMVGSVAGSAMSFSIFQHVIRGFEQARGLVRSTAIDSARVFGEYFDSSLTPFQAFGVEAMGTAILATIVFAMTHKRNEDRGIPVPYMVGGTVFTLINALAPLTQCGLNPARDFGPRIVAYFAGWTDVAFQNCWLYIAGPIVGALFGAALIDKFVYSTKRTVANFMESNVNAALI